MRCTHYQRFFSCNTNYEIFCLVVVYLTTCAISFSNTLLVSIEFSTCRFYKVKGIGELIVKKHYLCFFINNVLLCFPQYLKNLFFHRYIDRLKFLTKYRSLIIFTAFIVCPPRFLVVELVKIRDYNITSIT